MTRNRVLLAADDPEIRFSIRHYLELHGMHVIEADGVQTAKQKFLIGPADAAIVDVALPDGGGLELLEHFKSADADVPVIMLAAPGSIELALRAIKEGAEQFLTKPVELAVLHTLLVRAMENRRFRKQFLVRESKANREKLNPFLGESSSIRRLEELIRRVVSSESPILIQGETGSGKGVLANWIHGNSRRADEVFMDLNCAGLEREFLETELFGHERGAFTGAVQAKPGLLEVADRGTVFLDEIGDIGLTVQPKLLKVLESHQFRRLGDVRDRTVDIRLISATHRDLKELVRSQQFREDLFFRITIIPVRIPPLRERQEDIPLPELYFAHRRDVVRRGNALVPVTHLTPAAPGDRVENLTVRFRTVGDIPCTAPVESDAATLDDIVHETAATRITERGATRLDDQANDAAMELRKRQGYF